MVSFISGSLVDTGIITKILLSIFLGAAIGLERELRKEPAGVRTHMLVCMASTAIVAVMHNITTPDTIARVVQGIITGVGFLGAGTIMSHEETVRGLTTAAGIWAISILGVIIGLGNYTAAILITLLAIFILELKFIEEKFKLFKWNNKSRMQ